MKKQAERRDEARTTQRPPLPVEDTRVADAWAREEARSSARARLRVEERRITNLAGGGKDNSKIQYISTRISASRASPQPTRARPGTFEWRYGRKHDALFEAGNLLARLWEKAGMTIASSANFLRGTASGYATDLPESRVVALDRLEGFYESLGKMAAIRLIDYCVLGKTAGDIARQNGVAERQMALVLNQHLRDCAIHFKLLGNSRSAG
ncbi:hypothetical protein [Aliihoeflea sp. 40Bstr573]|uniref:hypothetical protein n=1 Tax=Aliihoeflea sp. 40Bstr573 TaxID=2696467 RepID=UPI0020952004|nr:hypothetical protein [Aliihoeflea sp. 40Bstr573]MCO6386224.1 hypothetical protein [Aliihoeflea sp. 40Bstr573]